MCKEVASSKKTNSRLECKNRYPIYYHNNGGKMAIIDTLFMTQTAEKPYPLGPHIPISPYKGVPPPRDVSVVRMSVVIVIVRIRRFCFSYGCENDNDAYDPV